MVISGMMSRSLRAIVFVFILAAAGHASDRYSKPGPVQLTKEGRHWAALTLKKLSLEEKVGQMLNIRYYTDFQNFNSDAYRQFRDQLLAYHIGSVTLTVHVDGLGLRRNPPLEVAAMTDQLQRDSRLPLLISADFERGLASRVSFVPAFPDVMAFGAIGNAGYVERFAAITAEDSRALGLHWNFSPVADVNSNPDNPVINTRSFGEDPTAVGELVAAYVKGAKAHGMLTTAKHFPGHGDTETDSHLGVAKVEGNMARLKAIELPPFRKAVDAGVDAVMVAHLSVPALETDPNKVATVSRDIVSGVLKGQLGFKGVVVTDALEMRGLTVMYPPGQPSPTARAAVDAVKAGNDVILWPTDLDGAFHGIVDAVQRREISLAAIDHSVLKILEMKASVGLHKARLVDLEQVSYLVGKQEDMQFAQQVADEAVTLVRDSGKVLPLSKLQAAPAGSETQPAQTKTSAQLVAIVITDSIHSASGRGFETALKARRPDAMVFYVDNSLAAPMAAVILPAVQNAAKVLVAAYALPIPVKQAEANGPSDSNVTPDQATGQLLRQILDIAADKTVLLAMGNPYVAQNFTQVQTYICTYSNASSSELSAVKILFGELQPRGKLPVTLPGIAPRGFSLSAPSSSSAGGRAKHQD